MENENKKEILYGSSNFWLVAIREFGFPIVVALALMGGVGMLLRWVASDMLSPMLKAHLETLTVIQDQTRTQTTILGEVRARTEEDFRNGEARTKLLKEIVDEQKKTTEAILQNQPETKK